jgi:hypothetical protein
MLYLTPKSEEACSNKIMKTSNSSIFHAKRSAKLLHQKICNAVRNK